MKTRTCMRASPLLGAALVLALASGAFAQSDKPATSARDQVVKTGERDDLVPPWWRGMPGTSFQHWLFNVNQNPNQIPGTPWFPEINENPYGPPWLDTGFGDENWYDYWEGRNGVMNPWGSSVYLNLFNSAEPLEWKIVWIQMTWWYQGGEFYPPTFQGSEPPGELVWEQHEPLENGWYHTVYEIWIQGNPDFERVAIATDHYFDQIVVDTWCTNGDEPLGACCVEGQCVDTTTCDQCTQMGGWWYEGESCPEFRCPCTDALWHNGEPDYINSLSCDRRVGGGLESWVVDDVYFDEDVIVRDLHWWAMTDDAFQFQNSDDIIILTDAGGMPGQPVVELSDVYNIRIDTCQDLFERDIYVYSIEGLEIPLPAGTYWFGMRPVNQGESGQNFNMTAATSGSECYFKSEYFGYPDWTPGHEVFGEYHDIAFCVTGTGDDGAKYSQPIDCESYAHFSNMNSNVSSWMRFDDFVCTMTGDITKVVFWGCMWDCGHLENLAGMRIDLFEWIPQGPCGWQHGALLCSNTIPLEELDPVFECIGPAGEEYYRFTAYLPEPCQQYEDYQYALRIAGLLVNPDDPCIFAWAHTPVPYYGLAYSWYPPDNWSCGGPDMAFELYTEQAPCPWDFDGDGDVDTADLLHLLGCWGTPCGDVDGDGDTDTADLLSLLGAWGDCP